MNGDERAKKEMIAQVFGRAAPLYAELEKLYDFGRRLVELAQIPRGARVLDVGVGQGAVLFPAAEQVGPDGQLVGVDISEEMVWRTAAEISRRGLKNAEIHQMDAEFLGFPAASFDCVVCGFSLFLFPQLQHALTEFYRVLRPSGQIAVTTWGRDDKRWDWYDTLVAAYQAEVRLATQALHTPGELEIVFSQTGFSDIQVIAEETDIVYPDEEAWWTEMWSHGARASLERMEPAVLERFRGEAFGEIQALREPDGFHDLHEVLYTLAKKP